MSLPASIQAWMPAAQRVMARCAELAAVSSHPDHIDRAYLTDQHKQVNALAGQWMIEAGLQSQTDPAHIEPAATSGKVLSERQTGVA